MQPRMAAHAGDRVASRRGGIDNRARVAGAALSAGLQDVLRQWREKLTAKRATLPDRAASLSLFPLAGRARVMGSDSERGPLAPGSVTDNGSRYPRAESLPVVAPASSRRGNTADRKFDTAPS